MSFLKKLFGGGSGSSGPRTVAEVEYEGFQILTTPMEEGGQYRVCALIRKGEGEALKEHKLIRADICSTPDDASDIAIRKAKQMIDERSGNIF